MKSLETLWRVAARELAASNCTSADRDIKTVTVRVECEGLSFLTITLPRFGKDFERCLDQGEIASSDFAGFHRSRQGPLPVFLGGFLKQIFNTDGLLLDEPNVDCIFSIRQLTLMFGKILVPCSDARVQGAIDGYILCEKEVKEHVTNDPEEPYQQLSRVSALLFEDVSQSLENELYAGFTALEPRHGPGATADRLRGNAKFDQSEWTLRMEQAGLRFADFAVPNHRFRGRCDDVDLLEPGAERPVKVITVPKTLEKPRIIAIEPTCMQYMQQALSSKLVAFCEQDRVGRNDRHNIVHGQIGFTDQMPNRQLAAEGSLTGKIATLDLSEASDRVSVRHVVSLFSRWPLLQEAVLATRSTKAQVPGYGEIPLSKFASMGSALCFPIEAMVFLSTVYCGIENALNRPLTREDVISLSGKVRVYGDDILVPVEYVRSVIQSLEALAFKVNFGKSFWNGKFRESCGGDFYDGTDVTPVRVRRMFPQSQTDVDEVVSLVALRNLMYNRGLWRTTRYLDSIVERVLPHFPIVEPSSPLLGRHSFLPYEAEKMCSRLQRPLVKGYVAVSVPPPSKVSGTGALLKYFLKQGEDPFADRKHLERQGRPRTVGLKSGWMPPY